MWAFGTWLRRMASATASGWKLERSVSTCSAAASSVGTSTQTKPSDWSVSRSRSSTAQGSTPACEIQHTSTTGHCGATTNYRRLERAGGAGVVRSAGWAGGFDAGELGSGKGGVSRASLRTVTRGRGRRCTCFRGYAECAEACPEATSAPRTGVDGPQDGPVDGEKQCERRCRGPRCRRERALRNRGSMRRSDVLPCDHRRVSGGHGQHGRQVAHPPWIAQYIA